MFGAKIHHFLPLFLAICVCSRWSEIDSVYLWVIAPRWGNGATTIHEVEQVRFQCLVSNSQEESTFHRRAHENAPTSSLRAWDGEIYHLGKKRPTKRLVGAFDGVGEREWLSLIFLSIAHFWISQVFTIKVGDFCLWNEPFRRLEKSLFGGQFYGFEHAFWQRFQLP